MQYSIESRTPFADDISLIEYVFSIPAAYKIQKGWSKYLLRQAMKEVLPESIFQRTDKLGFATPQTFWLMHENQRMKQMIGDMGGFADGLLINGKQIETQWETIFSSSNNRSTQDLVWRYLNYLLWKKVNRI
jgi:asparagine synthase (glutamine-hydrolysing)